MALSELARLAFDYGQIGIKRAANSDFILRASNGDITAETVIPGAIKGYTDELAETTIESAALLLRFKFEEVRKDASV